MGWGRVLDDTVSERPRKVRVVEFIVTTEYSG